MYLSREQSLMFYQNLGKLFYAIAAIDKTVREEEINALKKLVKSEWLLFDAISDEFNADTVCEIEIVFDRLQVEQIDAQVCFETFITYKRKEEALFTGHVKRLILRTANAIAESFSGKNKSELMLLGKLNIEFKKP